MAQHIDNLRGEQGGEILEAGGSFNSTTYGEAQVMQIKVIEDAVLSGVIMPYVEGSDYYNGASLDKNDFVDGIVTAATVDSGVIQVFLHKKSTADA